MIRLQWKTYLIVGILLICLGVPVQSVSAEEREIQVFINEYKLDFEKPPELIRGTTLIPLRSVLDYLDIDVAWSAEAQTVTAKKGGKKVTLKENSSEVAIQYEDGLEEEVTLPVSARVIDGRMMVPLRFLSEVFDYHVEWDVETKSINIYSKELLSYELGKEYVTYLDFLISEMSDEQLQLNESVSEYLIQHGFDFFSVNRESFSLEDEYEAEESLVVQLRETEIIHILEKTIDSNESLMIALVYLKEEIELINEEESPETTIEHALLYYIGGEKKLEPGELVRLMALPIGRSVYGYNNEGTWVEQPVYVIVAGNLIEEQAIDSEHVESMDDPQEG